MPNEHDFKKFPELTNTQMEEFYFESPHKQIVRDFRAKVVKVIDGDTIRVEWEERDFDFPIRFLDINAPEMNEDRGKEVQSWLEAQLLGEEVDIIINSKLRVDKFGRLLGWINHMGMNIGDTMLRNGMVTTFDARNQGKLPNIDKVLAVKQWF